MTPPKPPFRISHGPRWEQGTWRDGVVNIGVTLFKIAVFIIMFKFMSWLGFF
jgi:hypothetical protein